MSRLSLTTCLIAALLMQLNLVSQAQELEALDSKPSAKEWLEERVAEFETYRFQFADEPRSELVLEPGSLLNWSNAERGGDVGALFLWTHNGEPQLIACAYGRGERLRHEFHSLSTRAIAGERGGEPVHQFKPGIEWRELPDAPPPAKQRALRLTQMRRQAERFRVTIGEREQTEMRLLRQPVYRTPEESAADAATFLFVQGTDPECVLMVEVTEEKKWQYSLTRQTKMPIRIELDGTQVLEIPAFWLQAREDDGAFYVLIPPPPGENGAGTPERR